MGFLSKVAGVLTSPLKATSKLVKGDIKGATRTGLGGGLFGGGGSGMDPARRQAIQTAMGGRRGAMGLAGALGSMRNAPAPMAGAQDYMNSFSPEDQQNIRSSWGGNRNGMNDWYSAAQGAGAVPPPQAATAPASPGGAAPAGLASAIASGAISKPGGEWGAQAAVNQGDMGIMRDIQRRRMTAKLGGMLE